MKSKTVITTTILIALVGLTPAAILGQTLSQQESALLPLPAELRSDAAIMIFTPEGSLSELRPGTNNFFCVADIPDDDRFSVACHPQALRPYLQRNRQLLRSAGREERDRKLVEEIRSGKLALPAGTLSRFISGRMNPVTGKLDSVTVWSEVAVPFARPEDTGLPTEDAGPAPWMMRPGHYGAHIMIDVTTMAWKDLLASQQ